MKKIWMAGICLLSGLLLFGCGEQKTSEPKPLTEQTQTELTDSDATTEKDETNKTNVQEEFAGKWTESVNQVENLFLTNKGIEGGMPKETIEKGCQAMRDDLLAGVISDDVTAYFRLREIVALTEMGHMGLEYQDYENEPYGGFYSLDVGWYGEDLYTLCLPKSLESYIGKKVKMIGNRPLDEVLDLLATVCPVETESGKKCNLYRMYPNMLKYLQIIDKDAESIPFTVEGENGLETFELPITKEPANDGYFPYKFEDMPFTQQMRMENMQNNENYSYRVLKEHDAIYFQYLSCMESKTSFQTFFEEMMEEFEKDESLTNLIIDVRFNQGGFRNILQSQLYKYKEVLKEKKIYLILGIFTASAGCQVYEDCLQNGFDVTSYGMPTGGAVHNYTEVKEFSIPETGLKLIYPSVFDDLPKLQEKLGDVKESITPDVIIDEEFEEFTHGTDSIIERIFADITSI